ncbi:cation-transporting P-type ATPase [Amphritea pacifica]|uniref:Cation-transporting P-type ATPase n=1 Tax=Amphritea pacifica TaxID=2811233 RepID=A0ABS2W4W0_9GAMM|nr:cation-transporting P-type ATPase [Amphritea pacifica]MBN0986747.1 cation-transporting P-type ATPase [Amphritea pacifica]MBN1007128.1 cation-transporting P-type ATPase [Amphritea pacifica]
MDTSSDIASGPAADRKQTVWHTCTSEQIYSLLETSPQGLTAEQVNKRQQQYGANRLPAPPRRSGLMRLLAQFNNVLIYVLVIAALITAALGHQVDSGVIVAVVLINALVGFFQEGKAEKAIDAVRNMLSQQAVVIRNGHRQQVPAEQLVPGDIVFIQSGDRVPADLHLHKLKALNIDEALLTGESVPVSKQTEPVAAEADLGDRTNLAFSGTLVSFGQGTGTVIATGADTEIGRISTLLAEVSTLTTPLTRQLDSFARWLTGTILLIAIATMMFGYWIRDYALGDMFLAAVGLAVAAIPEGLPAIITIALAIGVQRMAKRHAIIRRLPAVETLGSVSVICSDKTGTLTRNEMTVTSVVMARCSADISGVGYNPHGTFTCRHQDLNLHNLTELQLLCQASVLCNEAQLIQKEGEWLIEGDPTEGALLVLGAKSGLDLHELHQQMPTDDLIPFESEHRFMATLHHDHKGTGVVYIKGAIEAVLSRCQWQQEGEITPPLDQAFWIAQQELIASQGKRTLALATLHLPEEQRVLHFSDISNNLTLLGLVGIIDPPRDEAIDAVQKCHQAGIRVKMITGDHVITATAIAMQMGITQSPKALTGHQIEQMTDTQLEAVVEDTDVFARASPEHKLRIVKSLQAREHVVAMTGDGVNDAPSLKRANVGTAMGVKGTEAAKEASEMVLADDNFASITYAIEEGRTVFDNISKSILFILPTNGGEALTVLAAIALGTLLPVTPAQILWVNMITAVTLALALTFEPTEPDVMQRPPRNTRNAILSPFMIWRIVFVSLLMVSGTFGLFLWERSNGTDIDTARTIAVNTLVVLEVFYLLNSRFLTRPVLNRDGLLGNRYALYAIVLVMLFQLIFTYLPIMQLFFHTTPIDAAAWGKILAVGLILFIAVELEKTLIHRVRADQ